MSEVNRLTEADMLLKAFKRGGTTSELWASAAAIVAPALEDRVDPLYTVTLAVLYLASRTGLKWISAWRAGDVDALTAEARRLADQLEARR